MPKPQGECPYCEAAIPKLTACICPACGQAIGEGALRPEYIDNDPTGLPPIPAFTRTFDADTPDLVLPMFKAARIEGWKKRSRPYVDKQDRDAIAQAKGQAKRDRQWEKIAAKARAEVERMPWTLHEGGGICFLKRWVDRTEELRRASPPGMEPPREAPVFSQVWPSSVEPLVVPIRRKAELQKILDEQTPGVRLADLIRSRRRPGRKPGTQERTATPEWVRDEQEMKLLRGRLRARYPHGRPASNDPDARRYAVLAIKWHDSKKCLRENCQNFIPSRERRNYCGDSCKHAAKDARRVR